MGGFSFCAVRQAGVDPEELFALYGRNDNFRIEAVIAQPQGDE
jgi:hypothetical protein